MKALQILIIEDEITAAERLKNMLLREDPSLHIMDILDSVESSVTFLQDQQPDLIFMDVQLADGICFGIFDAVTITCPIVFTTAYDAFALKAFRVQALDYLLKPLKAEELSQALKRAKATQQLLLPDPIQIQAILKGQPGHEFRERFLVRLGATIRVVEVADIAYAYTEQKSVFVMTRIGRRFPLDITLEQLEKQLDPTVFFRLNRQFIVHIHAIKEMHVHSKARVKVIAEPAAPSEIIVSTERSAQFKLWLAGETQQPE